MRTEIITCDDCGAEISVIHRHGVIPGEYCFECLQALMGVSEPEGCQHEDNVSDAVPGRDTARLVCKECGYDRVEKVA